MSLLFIISIFYYHGCLGQFLHTNGYMTNWIFLLELFPCLIELYYFIIY